MSNLFSIAERMELGPYFVGLVCSWKKPGIVGLAPLYPRARYVRHYPEPRESQIQRADSDIAAGIVRPAFKRTSKSR